MKNRIAVIAAHPDDEVLGCGGTIAHHVRAGDEVHVLIMAEGVTSRGRERDRLAAASGLSELALAARTAHKILGSTDLVLRDMPDNRMDSLDMLDIVKVVEEFLEACRPVTVYTHHAGDLNVDHRRVHEAVVTACRPVPGQPVKTLLFFEIASSTEWQTPTSAPPFVPNWFVDIGDTLTLKLDALRAYGPEMRPWPHARSLDAVESLAHWRGATIGAEAAEAFILGRNIISAGGE